MAASESSLKDSSSSASTDGVGEIKLAFGMRRLTGERWTKGSRRCWSIARRLLRFNASAKGQQWTESQVGTRQKRRREIEVIGCLPLGTPKGGSGEDPERCPKIPVVGPAFLRRHMPRLEQRLGEQFHRRSIDDFCIYKSMKRVRQ